VGSDFERFTNTCGIAIKIGTFQSGSTRPWKASWYVLSRCMIDGRLNFNESFALSYTGLATAIGMDIEVPLMIRLLAADLYAARAKRHRLDLDLGLNLHLDADSTVPIPKSWAKDWWRVHRDPIIDEVLGPQTVEECLKFHAKQELAIERKRQADEEDVDPAGLIDPAPLPPARPDVPIDVLSRDTVTMLSTMTPACPRCLPNRDTAMKAFLKDQKHVRHLKAVRDTFQERRDAAARRAAGFLQLHEAAIAKELKGVEEQSAEGSRTRTTRHTTRATRPKLNTAQQSEFVRSRAEQELNSLINEGTDPKWTVGPTLDLNDIRALLDFGPVGPGGEHTGYHMDHSTGVNTGSDSGTTSMPPSPNPNFFSDISRPVQHVPDLASDSIPAPILFGTGQAPVQQGIDPHRVLAPAIPSHHLTPIDNDSMSDASLEQYLLDAPEIQFDSADNVRGDLPAGAAPGNAHNPIPIPSRSPSHISLSSDSGADAAHPLAVDLISDSDYVAGPEDVLGTLKSHSSRSDGKSLAPEGTDCILHHHFSSDDLAGPADMGESDFSSDELASGHDSILGDDVDKAEDSGSDDVSSVHHSGSVASPGDDHITDHSGDKSDASESDEVLSGPDFDPLVSPGDIDGPATQEPDPIIGESIDEQNDSGSDSLVSGPEFDSPSRPPPDDILPFSDGEDADMLAGPEDILGNAHVGPESEYEEDDDILAGPEDILGNAHIGPQNEYEEDDDILAGPEDILGNTHVAPQSEYEEDDDDFGGDGLGGRLLTAMLLGNLITEPMAGPSGVPARGHPYTPADFDDLPDAWFS
jgi:hypothetical protein